MRYKCARAERVVWQAVVYLAPVQGHAVSLGQVTPGCFAVLRVSTGSPSSQVTFLKSRWSGWVFKSSYHRTLDQASAGTSYAFSVKDHSKATGHVTPRKVSSTLVSVRGWLGRAAMNTRRKVERENMKANSSVVIVFSPFPEYELFVSRAISHQRGVCGPLPSTSVRLRIAIILVRVVHASGRLSLAHRAGTQR